MIFAKFNQSVSGAPLVVGENDMTSMQCSIGGTGLRRPKRDGRKPSTGARASAKYGVKTFFDTGIVPLSTVESLPLY